MRSPRREKKKESPIRWDRCSEKKLNADQIGGIPRWGEDSRQRKPKERTVWKTSDGKGKNSPMGAKRKEKTRRTEKLSRL